MIKIMKTMMTDATTDDDDDEELVQNRSRRRRSSSSCTARYTNFNQDSATTIHTHLSSAARPTAALPLQPRDKCRWCF